MFGHGASEDAVDFWALWDECKQDLLSHHCLRWMGGNHADAEDALSEACLRAWQAWSTKTPELTNIKGWFVRVVQNHCHNLHKAHTRQAHVVQCVEDIATMAGDQAAEDELAIPEDAALRRELGQYIRRVLDDLPPRLQEPAALYFLQDMSCADIATHLNLSAVNVRKRIQQARSLLQSQIAAYLEGQVS